MCVPSNSLLYHPPVSMLIADFSIDAVYWIEAFPFYPYFDLFFHEWLDIIYYLFVLRWFFYLFF